MFVLPFSVQFFLIKDKNEVEAHQFLSFVHFMLSVLPVDQSLPHIHLICISKDHSYYYHYHCILIILSSNISIFGSLIIFLRQSLAVRSIQNFFFFLSTLVGELRMWKMRPQSRGGNQWLSQNQVRERSKVSESFSVYPSFRPEYLGGSGRMPAPGERGDTGAGCLCCRDRAGVTGTPRAEPS